MPQTIDAVFFDRDGTLIVNRPYLGRPEGVELLPGTREALRMVRDGGAKLFLFTNQSGVGRGYFTMADVERVHRRMLELLDLGESLFSAVCIAPERPDEPSRYRKPSPRFIVEQLAEHGIAPERTWMIGDAPTDWEAGRRAGVRTAAIVSPTSVGAGGVEPPLPDGVEGYPTLLDWLAAALR